MRLFSSAGNQPLERGGWHQKLAQGQPQAAINSHMVPSAQTLLGTQLGRRGWMSHRDQCPFLS